MFLILLQVSRKSTSSNESVKKIKETKSNDHGSSLINKISNHTGLKFKRATSTKRKKKRKINVLKTSGTVTVTGKLQILNLLIFQFHVFYYVAVEVGILYRYSIVQYRMLVTY